MKKKQSGFTLIEIAIVLVIIGILLGGVLKGQEMIENAKIKNLQNDFDGITAAIFSYQDRYGSLPGDDARANTRGWTDAAVDGSAGNGSLDPNNAFNAGANENQYMWQHLRYSGLISGDPSGVVNNVGGRANPANTYGGLLGVARVQGNWGIGLSGNIICASNVPGKGASAIDAAFDDGVSNTGTVRGLVGGATPIDDEPTGLVAAVGYLEDGTVYTVCKQL